MILLSASHAESQGLPTEIKPLHHHSNYSTINDTTHIPNWSHLDTSFGKREKCPKQVVVSRTENIPTTGWKSDKSFNLSKIFCQILNFSQSNFDSHPRGWVRATKAINLSHKAYLLLSRGDFRTSRRG